MRDDEFEWDDGKAASNIVKHNVSFETARFAFDDPDQLEFDEPDPDELRYQRICLHGLDLYVVIYSERHTRIRIISARRASTYEQHLYEDR